MKMLNYSGDDMKKILIAILCALLFLGCSINVNAIEMPKIKDFKEVETSDDLIEKFIEITEEEQNTSLRLTTAGPRNFRYFKMRITNGSLIDRYSILDTLVLNIVIRVFFLVWTPLKLLRPTIYVISEQSKIDFTLEFKRDIPEGNASRYKYWTQFGEYENNSYTTNSTSIYNEKHTLKVEGFYGAVLMTKRTVMTPPLIVMSGNYDNITVE